MRTQTAQDPSVVKLDCTRDASMSPLLEVVVLVCRLLSLCCPSLRQSTPPSNKICMKGTIEKYRIDPVSSTSNLYPTSNGLMWST